MLSFPLAPERGAQLLVAAARNVGTLNALTLAQLDEWLVLRAFAEWNEDLHPRDDHGRFGNGGSFPTDLAKISGAKGSNAGGVYQDKSGQKWYVKKYGNSDQAASEHVANAIYHAVGAKVPETALGPNGELASKWITGDSQTLGQAGLTKESANKILDHYAADVFTANWDAVGTGHDNVLVGKDGSVARIDQGGTLLFRAQGGLKPEGGLDKIGEWKTLADRQMNPYYTQVFKAAGVKDGDALGQRAVSQIDKIVAARPKDGWGSFVKNAAPSASKDFVSKVGSMLESRQKGLEAKRAELKSRGLAEWDESLHPRDDHGRFGDGPANLKEATKDEKRSGDALLKSKEQKNWEKSLSPEDRQKIADYTSDTVAPGSPGYEVYQQTKQDVERIIANAPDFEGTVWRGSLSNSLADAKAGDIIEFHDIDSASRSASIAGNFIQTSATINNDPTKGPTGWVDKYGKPTKPQMDQGTLVKIDVKTGKAIERLSAVHEDAGNEREVLIPKGKYEVVSSSHRNEFHFVHLRQLSERSLGEFDEEKHPRDTHGKFTAGNNEPVLSAKKVTASQSTILSVYEKTKAGQNLSSIAAEHNLTVEQVKWINGKIKDQVPQMVKVLGEKNPIKAAPVIATPVVATPIIPQVVEPTHPAGYTWQEKTTGPQAGKYAYFKEGVQVSSAFPKEDFKSAIPTLHQGTGPQVVGNLLPSPTATPGWPIPNTVPREQGSNYVMTMEAQGKSWESLLTVKERNAVKGYTASDYHDINKALRGASTPSPHELSQIASIDKALAKAPTPPPPELVWRGISGSQADSFVKSLSNGDVIKMKGFQSTSIRPGTAHSWGSGKAVFEIKPAKGAYVKVISHHEHEYEYLLPHGASYRVHGVAEVTLGGFKSKVIQLEMLHGG
jgi:LysM repeat protein